jgi:hypothetical protein
MLFYHSDFCNISELIENFSCIKNYKKTDDIKKADIIIFNNFVLENRKLLIKNKDLLEKKIFCYIHEPLTDNDDNHYNVKMIKRLNMFKNINIITYSLYNKKLCQKYFNKKIYYLPINYYNFKDLPINYYNFKDNKFIKNIDMCIIHRAISDKIKVIKYNNSIIHIDTLPKDIIILDHFDKERDNLFQKLKIFINLHKTENAQLFETLRLHNLIYHRVIIISQKCIDYSDPLSKYVIFEDNNNLINKANQILNNYKTYYKKIYGNLTNKEIFSDIQKYYNNFESENNL